MLEKDKSQHICLRSQHPLQVLQATQGDSNLSDLVDYAFKGGYLFFLILAL